MMLEHGKIDSHLFVVLLLSIVFCPSSVLLVEDNGNIVLKIKLDIDHWKYDCNIIVKHLKVNMKVFYSHLIYTLQDNLKELSKYYHQALDRKSLLTSVLIEVPKEWEQKNCGIAIKIT